jgi:hypothetical protein
VFAFEFFRREIRDHAFIFQDSGLAAEPFEWFVGLVALRKKNPD